MANGRREESKLLARASGGRKAREAPSQAYESAAKAYDVISARLPVLADGLKAGQKGDPKALTNVMAKLSTNGSALLKSCK